MFRLFFARCIKQQNQVFQIKDSKQHLRKEYEIREMTHISMVEKMIYFVYLSEQGHSTTVTLL